MSMPAIPQSVPESKYWYFKNFFFFDMIDDADYKALDVRSEMVQCHKDEFVYLPGEMQDSVFFLKKGFIKLGSYAPDGREVILNVLQPGDIFGSIGGVSTPTQEFAQAISEVAVCAINTDRFQEMLSTRPDLSVQVIKTVGERMNKLERKLISLAFKDARTRILDFLRDFANDYGRIRGEEIHIDNFLTHQDVANLTATSRQLVSTIFSELREAGQIEYDRKHIRLLVAPDQLR